MAVEANMRTIHNAVSVALQLDGSNNKKAAYISYLQCIQQVSQMLLQDALGSGIGHGPSTKKCVLLGHQCMERIVELVDSLQTASGMAPSSGQSCSKGNQSSRIQSQDMVIQTTSNTQIGSSQIPTSGHQLPELPSPTHSLRSHIQRSSEPSPMEIAQRKNHQLMLAYKKRMSSISSKSPSATNMSLTLQRRMAENVAIARGRQEALAKKLEERQRRLEEEAARRFASTAGMSKDEQERRHIYSQVLIYEADAKPLQAWRQKLLETPDDGKLIHDLILLVINIKDHPLTQLLTKIQYTIYDKLRPLVLSYIHELNRISVPYIPSPGQEQPPGDVRSSDAPSPTLQSLGCDGDTNTTLRDQGSPSPTLTGKPPSAMHDDNQSGSKQDPLKAETRNSVEIPKDLTDTDQFDDLYDDLPGPLPIDAQPKSGLHSMDMDMIKDLASVTDEDKIDNLKKDALEKHMVYITSDVREGMDKLSAMFIVAYEGLDSATGRDLCWSTLEEPFFKPLWPYLLALYRLGSYHKEVKAAKAMTRLTDMTLEDLGVKDKFCPKTPGARPFQSCIDELRRLAQLTSPLAKLESIVRLCKLLCQTMEENSSNTQAGPSQQTTGADDLLPVLSYVIIHSRLPQLVAECHTMEEFIHEGYLMGEEGYCLTSLQTSLGYVISMAEAPIGDNLDSHLQQFKSSGEPRTAPGRGQHLVGGTASYQNRT